MEETKDNGKITDEQLLAISDIDIKDEKYSADDRRRRDELIKQKRLERYQKDPETFLEISDIICAAVRNRRSNFGMALIMGNASREEVDKAWSELNHRFQISLTQMDIESDMKRQAANGLIKSKGGILNFARGSGNIQ